MEHESQKLRVLIASDYPKVRDLLVEMVREEPGAVVVGQADSGTRAITLARSLRPDIALLDSDLPHTLGVDAVRLSRIGGLDAAVAISEEVTGARTIVLGNLDNLTIQEEGAALIGEVGFCREVETRIITFTLHQLHQEKSTQENVVFGNVEQYKKKPLRQRIIALAETTIVYGGLAILAGLGLMLTILLFVPGAILAICGLAVVVLGVLGRFAGSLWPVAAPTVAEYQILGGGEGAY